MSPNEALQILDKKRVKTLKYPLKSHTAWNKGIINTEEIKCLLCGKLFISRKWRNSKYCSRDCSERRKPFNGKHHTLEAKIRMSKSRLGTKLTEEHKQKIRESGCGKYKRSFKNIQDFVKRFKGKHLSEKRKKEIGDSKRGEKSNFWKGGVSFELYGIKFNGKLKEEVRKRDGYFCQQCKYRQKQLGYKLYIHHIDYDKQNNNLDNLISLCRSCHAQTNFNRDDWTNYFRKEVI